MTVSRDLKVGLRYAYESWGSDMCPSTEAGGPSKGERVRVEIAGPLFVDWCAGELPLYGREKLGMRDSKGCLAGLDEVAKSGPELRDKCHCKAD